MRPCPSPQPTPTSRRAQPAQGGPSPHLTAAVSFLLCAALATTTALAQGSAHDYETPAQPPLPAEFLDKLEFESLNFSRGGRSTAVAGVRGNPLVYYFGASGGGVWKTTDAGINWRNVSDDYFGVGSIGALAVAESDPNVVYAGTGSACPRGNISNGDGIYRSTDAGESWQRVGLESAGQIGRVRVHPRDPDVAWVAALGNIFGPNEERGIYRTRDGGANWEKVLFVSDRTGFVDLALDATNPRVLYAAAWRSERKPWTLVSGSEDGGIWKTTDGGDNWTKLAGGLPEGLVGRIGVAVSPVQPERVWALVEAEGEKGGLYRSDDAGDSWRKINDDSNLRQRPWYYTHIYADTRDPNTVYGLNVGLYRSIDGGKTFAETIEVPHGDNHDLWINPDDPANMINANDGGANVSFDGGASWSWQMNQPTGEFYRVFVDQQWPYRVYGPQQDNSTISIPSHGRVAWNREPPDWYSVGGCESGHIAVDPRNPDVVYAGCYGGSISRIDRGTGESREIIAYPQLQLGQAARDLKYRFQWNAPIRLSPHDASILYHTSQVVHRSTDEGQTWAEISPDLTTDDIEQQDFAGGPISRDSTGVEVYNTIFAFEESPHRKGELWAGTDDGRLHVSRDDGGSWQEVTPSQLPTGATINNVDISAHDPDRIFFAAYRYRENDFRPLVYRSNDGGKSWSLLTDGSNGIPATHFTRVVREDPERRGLLYVGTEFGLYGSIDDGARWQRWESELPVSPVTDMVVHRGDLVISTQGRGFWIRRDLSPLRQASAALLGAELELLEPPVAYRGGLNTANLHFWVTEVPEQPVELAILSGDEVLRSFEWKPGEKGKAAGDSGMPAFLRRFLGAELKVEKGLNAFSWNLRHEGPEAPKGVIHWGFTPGVAVPPGEYTVRLTSGEWSQSRALRVQPWPALDTTPEQYREQYELGRQIEERLDRVFAAIERIRELEGQIDDVEARLAKRKLDDEQMAPITELAKQIEEGLEGVETQLTQVKSKSRQDPLNFPPMLDNQLVELYTYVVAADDRPPAGARDRLRDLDPELERLLAELDEVLEGDLARFNELVAALELDAVSAGSAD
ncbi:MAG: glycosyl hydrolase [Acidobacteria bacterium]|nr:MAG: glycosyl hydrolase [Acidobacteriota bacterium]